MSTIHAAIPDEIELDIPGRDPVAEDGPLAQTEATPKLRTPDLVLASVVTFVPPMAFALAMYLHVVGWYRISWIEISAWLMMNVLAVAGVELGFHRLFTHKSYEAHRGVRYCLAALGSMAFQGPVIWWCSVHRKHHRYSDRPNDPHSIYIKPDGRVAYNDTFLSKAKGMLHAHMGWIWNPHSIRFNRQNGYVRDLYRDKDLGFIHLNYIYFLALGFVIPALMGGLLHGSLKGAFLGFLWGGFVRVFIMNHLTYWTINSVSHSVGRRPFRTADRSRNSIPLLFALPTFGQSYHNNHHAFPASWRMSYEPYEIDVGLGVLKVLRACGLVYNVHEPTAEARDRKRLTDN